MKNALIVVLSAVTLSACGPRTSLPVAAPVPLAPTVGTAGATHAIPIDAAVFAKLQKRVPWELMNFDQWEPKPLPGDPTNAERDGKLSLAEYQHSDLERTNHLPQDFFRRVDANRDGYLSQGEAGSNLAIQLYYTGMQAGIPAMFKAVDRNHDGALTVIEWSSAIENVPVADDKPIMMGLFLSAASAHGGFLTLKQFEPMFWQVFAKTHM